MAPKKEQESDRLSQIPEFYRPILPAVSQLSDQMIKVLGGLLPNFTSLPDPIKADASNIRGAFVGYDGITNRGHSDHLLISEWALQSIHPEEFARRFAEGEALYTKREFRQRGDKMVATILVSCGPQSLGHGRLVALAALLHISSLVQKHGAQLYWCPIIGRNADGQYDWYEGLSRKSLRSLLTRASTTEPSRDDITDALEYFSNRFLTDGSSVQQLNWSVTPAFDLRGNAAALKEFGSYVFAYAPSEGIQTARPSFDVSLLRGDRRLAFKSAQMPPNDECVAALRRPLAPAPKNSVRSGKQLSLNKGRSKRWEPQLFAFIENRLAVIRVNEGLVCLNRSGRWKRFVPIEGGEVLAGFSATKKKVSVLTLAEENDHHILSLKQANWRQPGSLIKLKLCWSLPTKSYHLFRKFGEFSLPFMDNNGSDSVTFYSASGRAYRLLNPDHRDQKNSNFKPLSAGNVIACDGISKLHLTEKNAKSKGLMGRKPFEHGPSYFRSVDSFNKMPMPRDERRILWDQRHHILAVNMYANHWAVSIGDNEERSFSLSPPDAPIKFELAGNDTRILVVNADGNDGNGAMEWLLYSDGELVSREKCSEKSLAEGISELNSYALIRCDTRDGNIWGVRLSSDGEEVEALECLGSALGKEHIHLPVSFDIKSFVDLYR